MRTTAFSLLLRSLYVVLPFDRGPEPDEPLERLRSEFVFGIDEHIRTRLAGIIGMTDLLLETRLDDRQKDYASSARVCAADLLEQLNSAVELSQFVHSAVPENAEFNLRELVEGMAASCAAQARARGIAFRLELDESVPQTVIGDPALIGKTLAHLFQSALRGATCGDISLRASVRASDAGPPGLHLELRLSGDSAAATHFERVFDSLRNGRGCLARRLPGLALDAAVLAALVHVMAGGLSIETRLESGSVVRITIPLER